MNFSRIIVVACAFGILGPAPLIAKPGKNEKASGALRDETAHKKALIELMKKDIKADHVKAIAFKDVTRWEAGKPKVYLKKTYQTGIITYSAETIFGRKDVQAQAYIDLTKGKIVAWTYLKTGLKVQ